MNTKTPAQIASDKALIEQLGGVTQLAKLLGFTKPGSIQRVQNWKDRGIPLFVKLEHPQIFLPHLRAKKERKASQKARA